MVEAEIGPNSIYENDETEESDVHDLVDDRAVPNISIPIQLHSTGILCLFSDGGHGTIQTSTEAQDKVRVDTSAAVSIRGLQGEHSGEDKGGSHDVRPQPSHVCRHRFLRYGHWVFPSPKNMQL